MYKFISAICLFSFISAAVVHGSQRDDKSQLSEKAQTILRKNCYQCHGRDGANEGGVNYIVNLRRLVERRKVRPGQPAKSRLLKRILDSEHPMPPADAKIRPGKAEIALLRKWIEAGAPALAQTAKETKFISNNDALTSIREDLAKVNSRDRRFTRYFTLTHLHNAGLSADELQSHRHALSKLVNSLSWGKRIVVPRPIDPATTIFRIDLRDYGWNEKVWDMIVAANPYGVSYENATAKDCYQLTRCRLPYVRGDWFVAAASSPPLYHDVLQLPASLSELEKMLRVDIAENIRQERVARAGFNGSGVSRNNRLIERHESGNVVFWISYDFAGNVGRQNLFSRPLGPGSSGKEFQHDGGEIIFTLPNGSHAYMLTDGAGRRIDKGPQSIVSDPKRPDRAVHNGISCMSCHARGMIVKQDQIRDHVLNNPGAFAKEDRDAILALYPPKEKFLALLQADGKRFQKAVEQTGAPLSVSEPVVTLTLHFEAEMDVKLAAAEAGARPKEFLRALDGSPLLAQRLGPLRVGGGTIQRQVFVNSFPHIVRALRLGKYLTPTNTPYTRAVARGDALFEQRKLTAAVEAYTKAANLNPDHPLALLHRGSIFRAQGDLARALADFSEAIRVDPQFADAWHTRASLYHDRGDIDRAIADYSRAIQIDPKDAVLLNNRGLAFGNKGDLKRAVADFDAALRVDPANADAWHNRGRAHVRLGELRRALEDFSEALKLNPKSASAWHSRGAVHHKSGKVDAAIADYSEAIRLDPKNAVIWNNRGYAYFLQKEYRRAVADCDRAIQLNAKFAQAYFNRANAHLALGNNVQAAADRETALRLDPSLGKKK